MQRLVLFAYHFRLLLSRTPGRWNDVICSKHTVRMQWKPSQKSGMVVRMCSAYTEREFGLCDGVSPNLSVHGRLCGLQAAGNPSSKTSSPP